MAEKRDMDAAGNTCPTTVETKPKIADSLFDVRKRDDAQPVQSTELAANPAAPDEAPKFVYKKCSKEYLRVMAGFKPTGQK